MDSKSWEKAKQRASIARTLLDQIEREPNYNVAGAHWKAFLTELGRAFNKIAHGAKAGPSADIWKGISRDRERDPLLLYLRKARNQLEHRADDQWAQRTLWRKLDPHEFKPFIEVVVVDKEGNEQIIRPDADTFVSTGHELELVAVTDGKSFFSPPDTHLGEPLADQRPTTIGRAALGYLNERLAALEALKG